MARALLSVVLFVVATCGGGQGAPAPADTAQPRPDLVAVLVATQLVVGEQRVPLGILDRNTPVNDAKVRVRAYRDVASDPLRTESDAPFKGEGLEGKGVYVARLKFGAAGRWIGEITAQRIARQPTVLRIPLNVSAAATVPAPGMPAPPSRNLTIKDVQDVRDIDSGTPPNDMHALSIAEAIAQHRPALVVFATPAFCQSAMCGPQVHAVQQLEPAYRDRIAFIHVEVFEDFRPDPSRMHLSRTMTEWRLETEPWVFLIDAKGIIRFAFEGPAASDELREGLDRLLSAGM